MRHKLGQIAAIWIALQVWSGNLRADQVLYRYEGTVVPYDPSAGWSIFNACDGTCSESILAERFRLTWTSENSVNYHYLIAQSPALPPSTLWIEWRFRSNHAFTGMIDTCDASFVFDYGGINDVLRMYGDAIISFSGDDVLTGLALNEFHTYRFESVDGISFRVSADGQVFIVDSENSGNSVDYMQMWGRGGCIPDPMPNSINEWDFVRYGTIGMGEQVDSTTPPSGALGAGAYTSFTSFLVTFDQPNYVYVDDITVSVTGGSAPVVTATRRTDTHDEKTVEIVLDRALPPNELTTFTLTDGTSTTDIHYDFRPGPAAIPTINAGGMLFFSIALLVAGCFVMRGRAAQGGTVGRKNHLSLLVFN